MMEKKDSKHYDDVLMLYGPARELINIVHLFQESTIQFFQNLN